MAKIFTSASRVKVLQTLHAQELPIHLRLIGTLTECPIHSVELSLVKLHAEGLVSRRKEKRRILYSLNRHHASYRLIDEVLTAAKTHRIRERSDALTKRAQSFPPFLAEATRMIETARLSLSKARR